MVVKEAFFDKSFTFKTKNPYVLALDIMDFFSKYGNIIEKRNEYLVSGPRRLTSLEFELRKPYDKYSRMVISVSLKGEEEPLYTLTVSVKASFQINMPQRKGLISDTYSEFYEKNILSRISKWSRKQTKQMMKEFKDLMKAKMKEENG
jgi:hypothetical protein